MSNHYKISKWRAEQIAIGLAKKFPVVIVNPSAPVGPRDVKPTPTGQVIVDFLNRKLPALVETGLNWVHVRDVASATFSRRNTAASASATFWETRTATGRCGKLWRRSRKPPHSPPRMKVPHWIALAAAHVDETISRFTGSRRKRRWPACAWRNIKCGSIPPKPSANSACRKRRRNRLSPTPSIGSVKTAT